MATEGRPAGLIQRYREELEVRHYARRTVKTYEQWLRRFLRFHGLRHPRTMGSAEVNAFLTHLAVGLKVSPSTQNQALAALLFLYRELLAMDLDLDGVVRARTRRRLPVVLTPVEVRAVMQELDGVEALVAGLLYGSGLRLMEALRLRVKDFDFACREITVRDGKGGKDRRTLLPGGPAAGASGGRAAGAPRRSCRRLWAGVAAACAGEEIPKGAAGVGVAVGVSPAASLARFRERKGGAAPPGSKCDSESGAQSCACCRDHQTGHAAYLPPFLRHAPSGARPGYPYDSGADGPPGCKNNHDLHPCTQSRPPGRKQPS